MTTVPTVVVTTPSPVYGSPIAERLIEHDLQEEEKIRRTKRGREPGTNRRNSMSDFPPSGWLPTLEEASPASKYQYDASDGRQEAGRWKRRSMDKTSPTEESPLLSKKKRATRRYSKAGDVETVPEEVLLPYVDVSNVTWKSEARSLFDKIWSITAAFQFEYLLMITTISLVGRLGTVELGAASIGCMTANLTGVAVVMGLASALDTLCAQAFGSGRKGLVGLQVQRMVLFLWSLIPPIALIWWHSGSILRAMIPEPEAAELAGTYLRILLCGLPGYMAFECGKRYVQAQSLFHAPTMVVVVAVPFNAALGWHLVWNMQLGFIGAPIALACTHWLMPVLLICYVGLVKGRDCWDGLSVKALHNWGPMIRLAVPGFIYVESEYLAYEVLTIMASYLSLTHLSAQFVLNSTNCFMWMAGFAVSIATSTRIANLIGAGEIPAARTAARVGITGGLVVGLLNALTLCTLRRVIPRLMTDDLEVIELAARASPVVAGFLVIDALSVVSQGILRGLGLQGFGGMLALFSYYLLAMPSSYVFTFLAHLGLEGLWIGFATAQVVTLVATCYYICTRDWQESVEAAAKRAAHG